MRTTAVDIGVLLPTGSAQWGPDGDPRDLVAFGVHAERSGFSSLFAPALFVSVRVDESVESGRRALEEWARRRTACRWRSWSRPRRS
jgi:hypothetical protein